jgi:hypothetical protein
LQAAEAVAAKKAQEEAAAAHQRRVRLQAAFDLLLRMFPVCCRAPRVILREIVCIFISVFSSLICLISSPTLTGTGLSFGFSVITFVCCNRLQHFQKSSSQVIIFMGGIYGVVLSTIFFIRRTQSV